VSESVGSVLLAYFYTTVRAAAEPSSTALAENIIEGLGSSATKARSVSASVSTGRNRAIQTRYLNNTTILPVQVSPPVRPPF